MNKLRAGLRAVTVKSKGRPKTAAAADRLISLLDVMDATTPAEFHRRVEKLPVRINPVMVSGGRRLDVYVNDKLKASWFVGVSDTPTQSDGSIGALSQEPSELAETVTPLDAATFRTTPRDYCEDDGWSGDCATEEEVSDAIATVTAVEAEVDGLQSDQGSAEDDCATRLGGFENCVYVESPQQLTEVANPFFEGPSDASAFDSPRCVFKSCAAEAAATVIGGAAWLFTRMGVHAIVARGTAAVGLELTAAVGGTIVAGAALGLAIGFYIDCLWAL